MAEARFSSRTLAVVGSVLGIVFAAAVQSPPDFLAPTGNLVPILDLAAILFGAITFLFALREAWRGRLSLRVVVGLAIAYHIVMLLLPLPTHGDVYSYALYGRMFSLYHVNPYVATPSMFPLDPLYPLIPPAWVSTPSVYGPLFTLMSAALTRGIRGVTSMAVAYRLIAVAASLGITFIVAALAKRIRPERAAFAVAAVALNPVVLFRTVAESHNDVLVGLAIVGALWFVMQRRELAATALLTTGMLVKATAAVPLFLLVTTIVARRQPGGRLRALGAHVAVAGGLTLGSAALFLQTQDPTLGLAAVATHQRPPAVSYFVQHRLVWLLCRVDRCGLRQWATVGVRVAFALFFLTGLFVIARSLVRHPQALSPTVEGAAWGWGLLLLTLSAPVLVPWYMIWTLPLVWLLPRGLSIAVIATSIAVLVAKAFHDASRFPDVHDLVGGFEILGILAVFGVLVWLGSALARGYKNHVALDPDARGRSNPQGVAGERPYIHSRHVG